MVRDGHAAGRALVLGESRFLQFQQLIVDGVRSSFANLEVPDAEDGRQLSAADGGTANDSFFAVEGFADVAAKVLAEQAGDLGDAPAAADHFDGQQTVGCDGSGVLEERLEASGGSTQGLLDGPFDAGEERFGQFFELLAGDGHGKVDIFFDVFQEDGGIGAGGQGLLGGFASRQQAGSSALVFEHVELVLLLDLGSGMLEQGQVKVATTQGTVIARSENAQAGVAEGDDGNGERRGAKVDKSHQLGLGLGVGPLLVDAIAEGGGGRLAHDAEAANASDFGGGQHFLSLSLGEETGHGHHGEARLLLGLQLHHVGHFAQQHGHQLRGGEGAVLASVSHFDADAVFALLLEVAGQGLAFSLKLRVVPCLPNQPLQIPHAVSQVTGSLHRSCFSDASFVVSERNNRRCLPVRRFVGQHVDASFLGNCCQQTLCA